MTHMVDVYQSRCNRLNSTIIWNSIEVSQQAQYSLCGSAQRLFSGLRCEVLRNCCVVVRENEKALSLMPQNRDRRNS